MSATVKSNRCVCSRHCKPVCVIMMIMFGLIILKGNVLRKADQK